MKTSIFKMKNHISKFIQGALNINYLMFKLAVHTVPRNVSEEYMFSTSENQMLMYRFRFLLCTTMLENIGSSSLFKNYLYPFIGSAFDLFHLYNSFCNKKQMWLENAFKNNCFHMCPTLLRSRK